MPSAHVGSAPKITKDSDRRNGIATSPPFAVAGIPGGARFYGKRSSRHFQPPDIPSITAEVSGHGLVRLPMFQQAAELL